MTAMKRLTLKQELFVQNYLIDLNATQAAIRAGYSEKTARKIGSENLSKPDICAAIQFAAQERIDRTKVDAAYMLIQAKRMFEKCMTDVPVLDSEGDPTGVYKFDSAGAGKALKIMGDHTSVNAFKGTDDGEAPIDNNWTITFVSTTKDEYDQSRREKAIEHKP